MTTELDLAKEVIAQTNGNSPLQIVLIALVLVLLALLSAKPIMGLLREHKSNQTADVVDDSVQSQIKILQDQIEKNASDIRLLIEERNKWQEAALKYREELIDKSAAYREEVVNLKSRISHLEKNEDIVEKLKKKLDEKDSELSEKGRRIIALLEEVSVLTGRLHDLELRQQELEHRLSMDEERFPKKEVATNG